MEIILRTGVRGAGNEFQRSYYFAKINRLSPNGRLRGRAGTQWSGLRRACHRAAERPNL